MAPSQDARSDRRRQGRVRERPSIRRPSTATQGEGSGQAPRRLLRVRGRVSGKLSSNNPLIPSSPEPGEGRIEGAMRPLARHLFRFSIRRCLESLCFDRQVSAYGARGVAHGAIVRLKTGLLGTRASCPQGCTWRAGSPRSQAGGPPKPVEAGAGSSGAYRCLSERASAVRRKEGFRQRQDLCLPTVFLPSAPR